MGRGRPVADSVQKVHIGIDGVQDDVLILSGGRTRAVLEVFPVNFELLGQIEQETMIAGYASILHALPYAIQLAPRVTPLNLSGYLQELEERGREEPSETLRELADDNVAWMRKLVHGRTLLDNHFYLAIPGEGDERGGTARTGSPSPLPWRLGARAEARVAEDLLAKSKRLQVRCDDLEKWFDAIGMTIRRLGGTEMVLVYRSYWSSELVGAGRLRDVEDYTAPIVRGPRPAGVDHPPADRDTADGRPERDDPGGLRRFARGTRSVADLIAPSSVELARDYIRLDGGYARVLYLTGLPRHVPAAWLSPLIGFGEPIEISLHITPQDSGQVLRALRHKMTQYQSSRNLDERKGRLADPERETAFADAEELRDEVQRGEQKVYSVSIYVQVRGRTLDALDDITYRVGRTLDGMLAEARVAIYQQDLAFRCCLPVGEDRLGQVLNLDTASLAFAFPFTTGSLSMERGVLYGLAPRTHSLVIFDPFDPSLENANTVIFAKSGAGKSYFTKLMALRNLLAGVDFVIVDPSQTEEYRALCDAVGGQYVRFALGSGHQVNPLDLPPPDQEREGSDPLAEQIAVVGGLLEMMLADPRQRLSNRERAALDRALYRAYAGVGITAADAASWGRKAPVMVDLLRVLGETEGELAAGLAERLDQYVNGSLKGLFNGETNVRLDRRFTVFSAGKLPRELRPLAMRTIAGFIWRQARLAEKPRLAVLDEAWSVLEHDEGGRFLADMARTARKHYLGLVTITQDVADFLHHENGRTVLTNSTIKLLMKQDSTTIDPVVEAFGLTEEERRFLLRAGKGTGLFFARGTHVVLQVEASPAEHRLATTAPRELANLAAAGAGAAARRPAPATRPALSDRTDGGQDDRPTPTGAPPEEGSPGHGAERSAKREVGRGERQQDQGHDDDRQNGREPGERDGEEPASRATTAPPRRVIGRRSRPAGEGS